MRGTKGNILSKRLSSQDTTQHKKDRRTGGPKGNTINFSFKLLVLWPSKKQFFKTQHETAPFTARTLLFISLNKV